MAAMWTTLTTSLILIQYHSIENVWLLSLGAAATMAAAAGAFSQKIILPPPPCTYILFFVIHFSCSMSKDPKKWKLTPCQHFNWMQSRFYRLLLPSKIDSFLLWMWKDPLRLETEGSLEIIRNEFDWSQTILENLKGNHFLIQFGIDQPNFIYCCCAGPSAK